MASLYLASWEIARISTITALLYIPTSSQWIFQFLCVLYLPTLLVVIDVTIVMLISTNVVNSNLCLIGQMDYLTKELFKCIGPYSFEWEV